MEAKLKELATAFGAAVVAAVMATPLEEIIALRGAAAAKPKKKRAKKKAAPKPKAKRRGRPKGSKNKPKAAPPSAEVSTAEEAST